jgi:type IV pilus secretin PilQ/predicted competence protein
MFTLTVITAASLTIAQQSAQQQQPRSGRASAGDRFDASGERIIEFFDIHAAELRSVMRQLSAFSGIDIIVSDQARATVSLSVTNKTWREILAIVCMVHDLAYTAEASFVYVMPRAEAIARGIGQEAAAGVAAGVAPGMLMPATREEVLAPLVREVIPLRYTTTTEITPAITPFLSARGKLTSVQHTNSIILVDTDENMRQLRHLLSQIDIQTAQISISCKIIEVSSEVMQEMGINWGFIDEASNVTASQFRGPEGPVVFDQLRHSVTYGVLTPERFGIALSYLLEDNKAEIIAQPQITTLNNQEASIFMGQQIPINTRDEAGNTVTQMVNAGTRLTVTPYVSGDGKIRLSLNPSKETATFTADGTPLIREQSANTNVLVRNGETVVIAGLTSNEKIESEAGIPILKNIPILGNLFKRSKKTANKMDLVIFVTPHIIHSGI